MTGRRWLVHAAAALLTLVAGVSIGVRLDNAAPKRPEFHDVRVVHPKDFQALIDPDDPEVVAQARQFHSLEAAYLFVRDRIDFDPAVAAGPSAQILRERRASCLGKATLLVSLYRALGVPADNVRVVTGQVSYDGSLIEHAWVDLEYGATCLQQDPTDLLGVHDFLRFAGNEYTRTHAHRELFCFNDEGFAAVSQLNRLRGLHPQVP